MIDEYPWQWQYETCMVCREGKDKGYVYGCLRYGGVLNRRGRSDDEATERLEGAGSEPSDAFIRAAIRWNWQAKHPIRRRRAARDQLPLDLKSPVSGQDLAPR